MERGIASDQLCLQSQMPMQGHLAVYGDIDIGLDTVPYGGGTTSYECLWMGVPVITLRGDRRAGRSGASLLTSVGSPELIAESPAQYIALAVELAGDLDRLAAMRAGLRGRMRATLCDGPAFTRDLEQAYRTMWQRWCGRRKDKG